MSPQSDEKPPDYQAVSRLRIIDPKRVAVEKRLADAWHEAHERGVTLDEFAKSYQHSVANITAALRRGGAADQTLPKPRFRDCYEHSWHDQPGISLRDVFKTHSLDCPIRRRVGHETWTEYRSLPDPKPSLRKYAERRNVPYWVMRWTIEYARIDVKAPG